jgi:hypothetical protein
MRIGIVGGVDRNAPALAGIARASGHELEHHTGVISGAASSLHLKSLIARSELVVVVTDINSHNGVRTARREARLRQRPVKIVRRLGTSQFAALLEGLPSRASDAARS